MSEKVIFSALTASNFANTSLKRDDIIQSPFSAPMSPECLDSTVITATTAASLGNSVTYNLPQDCNIHELYLQVTMSGTTGATWPTMWGLALIDRIQLYSGNNLIEDISGKILRLMATRLYSSQVGSVFRTISNSTSGPMTGYIPLPLFFSRLRLKNPHVEYSQPLPAYLSTSPLQLKISFNPLNMVGQSGITSGSITDARIWVYYSHTTSKDKERVIASNWKYKTTTFQDFPVVSIPVGATTTNIDLSTAVGEVIGAHILTLDNTSFVNNRWGTIQDAPSGDSVDLFIDGRRLNTVSTPFEVNIINRILLYQFPGNFSNVNIAGLPFMFQFPTDTNPQNYSTGLVMSKVNNVTLRINGSIIGSTGHNYVFTEAQMVVYVRNGFFERIM